MKVFIQEIINKIQFGNLKAFAVVLFSLLSSVAFAQLGELSGKVIDEQTGEGVPFATVVILEDGVQKGGASTDFDGNYTIKPINPGEYTVKMSYVGYQTKIIEGVLIQPDKERFLDGKISVKTEMMQEVVVVKYKVPLISKDNTTTGATLTKETIQALATRDVQRTAALSAGVTQGVDGGAINMRGGRSSGTVYYVDGIPVRSGSINIPQNAIEQINTVTGGIPARYGDATGGIINITTSGPSAKTRGGVQLLSSQFIQPQDYNLINFNLTGPIAKRNKGTDMEESALGYFIATEFVTSRSNMTVLGYDKVKDDKIADLLATPLQLSSSGAGVESRSEYLTNDDIENVKVLPNTRSNSFSSSYKVDYKVNKNVSLTLGGQFVHNFNKSGSFGTRGYLMNNNAITNGNFTSARGYLRFTQRFNKDDNTDGGENTNKKASLIQNAYYQIQLDYEKTLSSSKGAKHGKNIFEALYYGKYDVTRSPVYTSSPSADTATGLTGILYSGDKDNGVTYTPGGLNPNMEVYTQQYLSLVESNPASLTDIVSGNGLRNGDLPFGTARAYSLFTVPGLDPYSWGKSNTDQARLRVTGAFDIKNPNSDNGQKHAIEFGFVYEQRTLKSYSQNAYSGATTNLWNTMRLLTNKQLSLDLSNPMPLYDAYGNFLDTINYNYRALSADQSQFDKSLRETLGLDVNGTDYNNIDNLDPSTFSLNMFSAEELINNSIIGYSGYDKLGNRLKKQPSLEDFFSTVDKNGNLTRSVGAFKPIYTAAYIQDRFTFKDLIVRMGLRIDRFDANQPVLKDPNSLYPTRTASEVTKINGNSVTHPSTIGDDYVVYVDDAFNPNKILGYRDGTVFYDENGIELSDPQIIAAASNNGQATPYLKETDAANLKLDEKSFVDYTPQINVMPRLAFSFPISDEALFYAHYDILTQRPQNTQTPYVGYYNFDRFGTAQNGLANPNLKPEKTISYELGFRQKISNSSAITLSGFYREFRNMVQLLVLPFAYPGQYLTNDNIGFGTSKGFEFVYDLRRTKNLSLKANYTLSFAEGTSSSSGSGNTFINKNNPMLVAIFPFSFDVRHNINVNLGYNYGGGKDYNGPVLFNTKIFENAGLNLTTIATSGRPYTKNATAPTIQAGVAQRISTDGTINGNRMPWTLRADLRAYKNFFVKLGKSGEGEKPRKRLVFNAYVQIQNLLNTKNIKSVYTFTGSPTDDGYLASALGQQKTEVQLSPQSFTNLYTIAARNNGAAYSRPRTVRIGLNFNF